MNERQNTMLASELIAALQVAVADRGDIPVYLRDPDTKWPLGITLDPIAKKLVEDYPDVSPCMSINASYFIGPAR